MTVNTLTSSAEFETDASNRLFPFTFKFLDRRDLVVAFINKEGVATPLALGVDYIVSGEGSEDGGQVTTTVAPAALGRLVVSREMEATQKTALRNQGRFFAEVHETVFDRLTMLVQQAMALAGRALRTSVLEPAGIDALPLIAQRADRLLAFDAEGQPITSNLTLDQLEQQPALAIEAVAQAQAAAGASQVSAGQAQSSAAAAAGAATASSNSAALAQKWADNAEDVPVTTGKFSARHWAAKAAASLSGLLARVTTLETQGSLGVGQTYRDLTASRALNTVYTNSTSRTIYVHIDIIGSVSNGRATITVTRGAATTALIGSGIGTSGGGTSVNCPISPGDSYSGSLSAGAATSFKWSELMV